MTKILVNYLRSRPEYTKALQDAGFEVREVIGNISDDSQIEQFNPDLIIVEPFTACLEIGRYRRGGLDIFLKDVGEDNPLNFSLKHAVSSAHDSLTELYFHTSRIIVLSEIGPTNKHAKPINPYNTIPYFNITQISAMDLVDMVKKELQ